MFITIDGIFMIEFGDNSINMEEKFNKYKIDIEMLKMKYTTSKYNL